MLFFFCMDRGKFNTTSHHIQWHHIMGQNCNVSLITFICSPAQWRNTSTELNMFFDPPPPAHLQKSIHQ